MKKILIIFMALISFAALANVERLEYSTWSDGVGLQPCEKARVKLNRTLLYEIEVACLKYAGTILRGAVHGIQCRKEAALQCSCSGHVWVDCQY
jgi:DMSO/TMAO reductase YedYZ heme-binding membrane subunit